MSPLAAAISAPDRLEAVRRTGLLDTPADETFDRLATLAARLLHAPLAFVTLVDDQRSFWKSCIGVAATDVAERQNPVEESFCQHVVDGAQPLIVGDTAADERTRANPSIASMGVAAWAGFPVFAPDGEVLGSFCVVDLRTREWTERDVEVLRTLSLAAAGEIALREAAAEAVSEARRATALARSLQESLLPPRLPDLPGLEVAAGYRAGGTGAEVVGDFYDVFASGPGEHTLVIGDVGGKGVEAAKVTGLARWTVRTAAIGDRAPCDVLRQLNDVLRGREDADERYLTAVVATVRRTEDGAAVVVCSAGHVPPFVVRGGGLVEPTTAFGTLLGPYPEPRLQDARLRLAAGDALVLYTDGVTEARRGAQQLGEAGLERVLAGAAGHDAAGIVAAVQDAVLEHAGDAVPADDAAVLVLRVPPADGGAPGAAVGGHEARPPVSPG